ncbi:MAG TPA: hypothetical protein VJ859_10805 [Allosphingosinicella sp.]|nr:hypothetical protein [Allosphingosinicella sp.]
MTESFAWVSLALIAVGGLSIMAFAFLKAWNGWLAFKRAELSGRRPSGVAERIEISDLKERIRKLESIAACIDP